jgi:hypothetical protein
VCRRSNSDDKQPARRRWGTFLGVFGVRRVSTPGDDRKRPAGRLRAFWRQTRGYGDLGRKAPVKYRGKAGNTWTGRGAPRWLVAAIKRGKKLDDFLIDKQRRKRRSKR